MSGHRIATYRKALTTVGAAGSAAASASIPMAPGKLLAVQVAYTTMPATTDVTIKNTLEGVQKTLLTLTNNNTSVPLKSISESLADGVNATLADSTKNPNIVENPIVCGTIDIAVAQGDAVANGVIVTLIVEH